MVFTTIFLMGIDHIDLPISSHQGWRFADVYYLATNSFKMREIVKPFSQSLGTLEITYLVRGGAKGLIYKVSKQELDASDMPGSIGRLLIDDMATVKTLQRNLWIIKDNAFHFDRSWIGVLLPPDNRIVNNNTWASRDTCADGHSARFAFMRKNGEPLD